MLKMVCLFLAAVFFMLVFFSCGVFIPINTPESSDPQSGGEDSSQNPSSVTQSRPEESGGNEYKYNISAQAYVYEYHIPERYYSAGIKNIVRRARQIHEIKWLPLEDLIGFNGENIYEKGREVIGVPYGQPVFDGAFVGFEATLDKFLHESKNKGSLFYTGVARYEENAPYYSLDCTAFVCYAWATNTRMNSSVLVNFGDKVGNAPENLQVGDALIRLGDNAHAVLVSGVVEDENNNIVWLEIIEQTPPDTRLTRYGEGEIYSVAEFLELYLNDGYFAYRNTDYRDSTPYYPTPVSPLDGEKFSGSPVVPYRNISAAADLGGLAVNISASFAADVVADSVSYEILPSFYGVEKYITRPDAWLRLRDAPFDGETVSYIPPSTKLSVYSVYTDQNGEKWGKLRYRGQSGWIWLEGSELTGGTLTSFGEVNLPSEKMSTLKVDGYQHAGIKADFSIPFEVFTKDCFINVYARDKNNNTYLVDTIIITVEPK